MGAEVQGPPTGTQPHEGSYERPNSSLHVRPGTTNRISIHCRGASLPLPVKLRMSQIETFDGTKDYIDHLNTNKNQMEMHGYQEPNSAIQTGHVATEPSSSGAQ